MILTCSFFVVDSFGIFILEDGLQNKRIMDRINVTLPSIRNAKNNAINNYVHEGDITGHLHGYLGCES